MSPAIKAFIDCLAVWCRYRAGCCMSARLGGAHCSLSEHLTPGSETRTKGRFESSFERERPQPRRSQTGFHLHKQQGFGFHFRFWALDQGLHRQPGSLHSTWAASSRANIWSLPRSVGPGALTGKRCAFCGCLNQTRTPGYSKPPSQLVRQIVPDGGDNDDSQDKRFSNRPP